jgi:hypothetical protein
VWAGKLLLFVSYCTKYKKFKNNAELAIVRPVYVPVVGLTF